uniref:Integrase, catalytic region, zinc finger, CCHC-type, peptidase aspartic, catalytic n=1 Tax=Tanacetum cinerariifolium TaxID=118510 RepID=A0A6L2NBF0_TANCI|nr:integrase, catalytic region, zinc finger, CCHC-type, peptidase aspartic, catalytic [Tanacetum cinerariifolium]
MGTVREPLAEGTKGAPHLGPEQPRDNVKMLLEGLELTKEDQESQLYDEFEHFRQHKGETIHDYYVRFAKLINDMRNIKMTMSRMQLNSKFVNNMLPEWGRFVTTVKLNRGLRDSNYDQLNQATVQDGRVVVQNVHGRQNRGQGTNPRGGGAAGYGGVQNRVGNANPSLDEEQLLFLAGGQDNAIDEDVDEQPVQDLALNVDNVFQADNCDAFDFDVDEAPTAQTMFMANLSSADPVYDEAEPSYDSDILFEAIVHNTEDTLEIAEITRRKINDKMKVPECVNHKTTASRAIKALTVYPPNTPATLVPRVLPTKSQVKIHIFTLIQLFSEFDKTYKKRITPTGLTKREMGFEQTKECYLKEVIPFSKTLKENFKGIQKALTKEIKEMKDVFEELEAEVAQNVVDRKHDEIERKNLLTANDNLIA